MSSLTFEDFREGLNRKKSEQVSDARGFQVLDNAYVNTGYAVTKRPGMENLHGATALNTNLKGMFMFDQKLLMFSHAVIGSMPTLSGYGINPPINTAISVCVCADPDDAANAIARVWQMVPFNRRIYAVVEYADGTIRHFYDSLAEYVAGTPDVITDANCPNTKSVVANGSKIYAIGTNALGQAYVKYSATEDPTDWSSPSDASGVLGLPVGLETPEDDEVDGVGVFRNNLVVFMTNNLQLWQTDEDPALTKLDTVIENGYSNFPNTIRTSGNDLLFLNKSGVYASGQMLYTDSMQATDVGAPIYDLLFELIKTESATYEPKAVHYSGNNQWILFIKDQLFVLTVSTASNLSAWAKWTLPTSCIMRDMCSFREYLFGLMETPAGTFVYSFNPDKYEDDLSNGVDDASIPLHLQSSFNSLGAEGNWKQIYGMDALFSGTANVQHRWDARTPTEKTQAISLDGDTRAAPMVPVELMTTEISFDITQNANSPFTLNGLTYYYNVLGEF